MQKLLILIALAAAPGVARAGDELAVVASKAGATITLSKATGSAFNVGASSAWQKTLTITCNWHCGPDVAVTAGTATLTAKVQAAGSSDTLVFDAVPAPGAGGSLALEIKAGAAKLATTLVPQPPAPEPPLDPPPPAAVDLKALVGRDCALPDLRIDSNYSQSLNKARVIATPRGMLLTQMPNHFDEDDALEVDVYGDPRVLANLEVRRTSNIRELQAVRIVGSDAGFNPNDFTKHGKPKDEPPPPKCDTRPFYLDGFAPGRGQVTLTLHDGVNRVELGTIDFVVAPLYSGIFSFGAIWTRAQRHDFAVLPDTGVITDRESGSERLDYVVFYTHYVWGKRDIEKPTEQWYHHINPTVALALSDLTDNGIAGLSVDLFGGFVLTGGVNVRRVDQLDPRSGLKLGSTFAGTTEAIPRSRTWETGAFFGVSVDLRAAVQLTRTVLGSATAGR